MRHPALVVTTIFWSLLFSYSSHVLNESAGNFEWQILTQQNFSSEIRLHAQILLLVTIPWSGEARSLMKQLGKLVADQPEKHGPLRLMIVYKNSQKLLADVLEATEDISLYYYHQSTSYKYHGRFAAENILSSVNYFMSLKPEEVPFKPLHTQDELEIFLKSTDKTVLLIELCGWSSKLLHKKNSKNVTSSAHLNYSENGDMLRASLFEEVDETLPIDIKKNQKGLENKGLYCGVENVLCDSHQSEEFCWANNSALEEVECEASDMYLSCKDEEFEQFKSFFSKFKLLAREFLLPPERIRFGLISDRTLLPYVGVNTMQAWLVMLQFNGCPSCSLIIEAGDDLRKILQDPYSTVMQLDADSHNFEVAFPANRPSVVLFIDRLSDLPVIREKSKSALDVFRKLAEHYQPSYRMNRGTHHGYSQSPTAQVVSESRTTVVSDSPHLYMKDPSPPNLIKFKDSMTIVINKGQSILSDQTTSYAQGNAVYDALLDFIHKRNLARKKQTKLSLLAKESGFQLLSNDFEVQVEDSSPYYTEHNLLSDMNKHKVMSTGDQTFIVHQQPSEHSVNQNDAFLAAMEEPAVDDAKQAALEDAEHDIQKYRETDTEENSNTNEDEKICEQNDTGSLICHDENSLLECEVPSFGICMKKDIVAAIWCTSSFKRAAEKVSLVVPSDDLTGDDVALVEENIMSRFGNQSSNLHQPTEDSLNQNEHKVMNIGDQTSKLHQQPSEDSVNRNDDLLAAMERPVVDDAKLAALGDEEVDFTKYLETTIEENDNSKEDDKSCEQNDTGSLICHYENSFLEQEGSSVGTCMVKDTVEVVGCSSSAKEAAETVPLVGPSEDFVGDVETQVEENVIQPSKEHNGHQAFQCSFFFIDGGYRLLNSLTGGSNIPSLVLLDPVDQHHYIFNEDRDIDLSSLINFIEKFLKGGLSPYQPSASSIVSSKGAPQPPFVNLDFHEVDAIPRVTTNTFCELVFGFKPCITESAFSISKLQNLGAAWKKDVLVLFGSSWCGFCQRMELLVREVFHAFKYLKDMPKCESGVINPLCFQDNNADVLEYRLPSVFFMDCMQNDCGSFLKSAGKNEHYPELLLYLAQNKTAIPYEGDMLVASIIKFLVSEGRNSQFLNKYKGFLWKHSSNNSKGKSTSRDSSPLPIGKTKPQNIEFHSKGHHIVPGSVLSATDKLQESAPFDNSTILITLVDETQQIVQGVMLNKPVSWNVFDNLDKDMEHIKKAPISYGGPVSQQGLPLVSLTKRPTEGYMKVIPGTYFGDPMITRMIIEGIKSGDRPAHEYWFFLGYCNWKLEQIFDELAKGAWHLSAIGSNGRLKWPIS